MLNYIATFVLKFREWLGCLLATRKSTQIKLTTPPEVHGVLYLPKKAGTSIAPYCNKLDDFCAANKAR